MILASAVAACTPAYRFQAASGGTAERASADGFGLTASVNAWPAGSKQMAGGVLPIWVRITNQSKVAARVSYSDFGALGEGVWFGVLDPKTGMVGEPEPRAWAEPSEDGSLKVRGEAEVDTLNSETSDVVPRLVLDADSAWTDGGRARGIEIDWAALECERAAHCTDVSLLPAWDDETTAATFELVRHRVSVGRGFSGPPRTTYYGYYGGYYRGYVGGYWGYPYYGYPYYGYPGYYGYSGYGGYPGYWGWPYYAGSYYWPYYDYRRPSRSERVQTSATMVAVALPEGELQPGATTTGFVYLPNAARRAPHLELTWTVHAVSGKRVTKVVARFVATEDE